jgi:multiphosphoryl transfer protein
MTRSDAQPAVTIITAPLSGHLVALEDVPDPVFAQKVVGDGISIDPITQKLLAPCDGRIEQLHRSRHAITIATESGIDVLIHIGLDTVELKGQGFTARVAVGDIVRGGDTLIEFDADFVATHAKSLLTQIIVTARDGGVVHLDPARGHVRAAVDVILRVRVDGAVRPQGDRAGGSAGLDRKGRAVVSKPIRVPNPTGLHARPAAVLATLARPFAADVRLRVRGREANAKSVVAVMSLEIDHGDDVEVVAEGADADTAAEAVAAALAGGLGEQGIAAASSAAAAPAGGGQAARSAPAANPNVLVGVSASGGVAVGRVVQFRRADVSVPARGTSPEEERRRLDGALATAKREL